MERILFFNSNDPITEMVLQLANQYHRVAGKKALLLVDVDTHMYGLHSKGFSINHTPSLLEIKTREPFNEQSTQYIGEGLLSRLTVLIEVAETKNKSNKKE